jgi:hypothetical protein
MGKNETDDEFSNIVKINYAKHKVNLKYNQHLGKRLTTEDEKTKYRILIKNINHDCTARIAEMKEISFTLIIIKKYHTTEKIEK